MHPPHTFKNEINYGGVNASRKVLWRRGRFEFVVKIVWYTSKRVTRLVTLGSPDRIAIRSVAVSYREDHMSARDQPLFITFTQNIETNRTDRFNSAPKIKCCKNSETFCLDIFLFVRSSTSFLTIKKLCLMLKQRENISYNDKILISFRLNSYVKRLISIIDTLDLH